MSFEFLQILWFVLIAILWTGFYFLEGFDFGVGMLLPFLGRNDVERRAIINSIGPVWDGNEVWLITALGATFTAFPHWYATMFSGFYLAFFIMLIGLLLRGIAFEYRSKDAAPQWRTIFDRMICVGSFLPAFILGVVFANLAQGVPINGDKMFTGNLFTLLNPYGILGGLSSISIFLLHGANFLGLKLDGELRERVNTFAKKLWILASGLYIGLGIFTYVSGFWDRGFVSPGIVPIGAVAVLLAAGYFINNKMEGWAFMMVGLNIILTQITFFSITFPNVMLSSLDPAWSLTIYNASSSQYSLSITSIFAVIFIPIILIYQGWTYYTFRQRITTDKKTLVY